MSDISRSVSVAELKARLRELGVEAPHNLVEKHELLDFVVEAERRVAEQDTQSPPISPAARSVGQLKARLRELGLEIPTSIVEKGELVALVEEAERQQAKAEAAACPLSPTSPTCPPPPPEPPRSGTVPPPWVRQESRSRPGTYYYVNAWTGKTTWEPWPWFLQESRSKPGCFYYRNANTGETMWKAPPSHLKETAQDLHCDKTLADAEEAGQPEPSQIDYLTHPESDAGSPTSARGQKKEPPEEASEEEAPPLKREPSHLSCVSGDRGVKALALTAEEDMAEGTQSATSLGDFQFSGLQRNLIKGQLIGRGSLGRVFKALDKDTGQIIALKEVPVNLSDERDASLRSSLENEVSIMRELRHPNIVSYLGHDYTEGCLFLYMEHVPGGSLTKALRQFGVFDEALIVEYTRQLLQGLEYMHSRSPPVVHRDIKGSNVLVSGDGTVKLADFGCSKRAEETLTQTMRGSIPWMAPEVIAHSRYGRASDIWSFGCVVIEMGTAETPWGRFDNQMAALIKIGMSNDTPPLPKDVTEACLEFILLCVDRDVEKRPNAAGLLSHEFVAVGPHEGGGA